MGVTVVTVTVTRELVPLLHVEYNIIGGLGSTYHSCFYVLKVSSHLLQDIEQSRAFRDENTGRSKITA